MTTNILLLANIFILIFGIYTLKNEKTKQEILIANSIDSRKFHTQNDELKNNIELINESLTKFDKILLEKIANSYKNRENNLVTRFFL